MISSSALGIFCQNLVWHVGDSAKLQSAAALTLPTLWAGLSLFCSFHCSDRCEGSLNL